MGSFFLYYGPWYMWYILTQVCMSGTYMHLGLSNLLLLLLFLDALFSLFLFLSGRKRKRNRFSSPSSSFSWISLTPERRRRRRRRRRRKRRRQRWGKQISSQPQTTRFFFPFSFPRRISFFWLSVRANRVSEEKEEEEEGEEVLTFLRKESELARCIFFLKSHAG